MNFFLPVVDTLDFHENFKRVLIKNNKPAQKLFNEWASGFVDRDTKLIKEFQTTFNSTFWEVYLFAVLKEYRLNVNFNYSSPDFSIINPNIIIEATTANAANNKTPEWEKKYSPDE